MEVSPLDAQVGNPKIIAIRDPFSRLLDRKIRIPSSQISDAAGHSQHHMDRVPLEQLHPLPVRRTSAPTIRLATSTSPLAASSPE